MTDAARLAYAISYLRRTKTLDQLKALADQVAAILLSGKTRVTVTGIQMEGGQTTGEVEFEAGIIGQACESLIVELDPTSPKPRGFGSVVVFH